MHIHGLLIARREQTIINQSRSFLHVEYQSETNKKKIMSSDAENKLNNIKNYTGMKVE
jgi:hypothetical protein